MSKKWSPGPGGGGNHFFDQIRTNIYSDITQVDDMNNNWEKREKNTSLLHLRGSGSFDFPNRASFIFWFGIVNLQQITS
jgi:hypothetical protein